MVRRIFILEQATQKLEYWFPTSPAGQPLCGGFTHLSKRNFSVVIDIPRLGSVWFSVHKPKEFLSMKRKLIDSCMISLLFGGSLLLHAAPPIISYSGQVAVNGSPFTGTGQFKFAFVGGNGQ